MGFSDLAGSLADFVRWRLDLLFIRLYTLITPELKI